MSGAAARGVAGGVLAHCWESGVAKRHASNSLLASRNTLGRSKSSRTSKALALRARITGSTRSVPLTDHFEASVFDPRAPSREGATSGYTEHASDAVKRRRARIAAHGHARATYRTTLDERCYPRGRLTSARTARGVLGRWRGWTTRGVSTGAMTPWAVKKADSGLYARRPTVLT